MSGIARRIVYVEHLPGYVIPHDWNMVVTGVGNCLEPSMGIFIRGIEQATSSDRKWDPTDEITRVDEIQSVPRDLEQILCGEHVHGGTMIPRVGR